MSRNRSDARSYTVPPSRGSGGKPSSSPWLAPLGLAAAAGAAWLIAPGSKPAAPAPAGAAPASAAVAPPSSTASAPVSAAAKVSARRELEGGGSARPAAAAAAVLATAPKVSWLWPLHLDKSFARGLTGAAAAAAGPLRVVRQTILSWDPAGVPGRRALYRQELSDGSTRERVESELNLPPRPVQQDPLVFDLDGRGIKTSEKKVIYGITGSRDDDRQKWMNEIEEGMGILVFDADKDGVSGKTGLELFGDQTDVNGDGRPDGHPDGYSALRALVTRGVAEGVLPPLGPSGSLGAAELAALERAYGLKMKIGGFNRAPLSLKKAGVVSIAYSDAPAEPNREFDGRGNGLSLNPRATFERADGSRGIYANVWLTSK